MNITAREVATVTGGHLVGASVELNGASIDSRTIRPGELFVPVIAERDGHDFIEAARAAGAAGYLTTHQPQGGSAIVVMDTGQALAELGRWARSQVPDSVVGITGSVGKTTTKDMMAAVVRRSRLVSASERSFNNELGVPLTLINAPAGTETVILEMGARGRGHIGSLCTIARPTVGVVTTIALAHAELFGDLEAIAEAKGELIEALPKNGIAILNADDPLVAAMSRRAEADVLTFGEAGDVAVDVVGLDDHLRASVVFQSPWGTIETVLGARGAHQATNAAAAAAGALAIGVPIADVAAGLTEEPPSAWRMELVEAGSGALLLNDVYNANRTSTEAALHALAALDRPRKTAVLGFMAELGDLAAAEHAAVASLAGELGIRLVAYGTDLYGVEPVSTIEEAEAALGVSDEHDAVLVKGSRVNELERLVGRLLN